LLAILDTVAPVPGNLPTNTSDVFDASDDAATLIEMAKLVERVVGKDLGVSRKELNLLGGEEKLQYFLEKLKQVAFVSPDAGPSLIRGFLAVQRASSQASQRYISQTQIYPDPITLFLSDDVAADDFRAMDRKLRNHPTLGWSELVSGQIETHIVPGDHISMLTQPHVQLLANKLTDCIDRACQRNWQKEAQSV